MQNYFLSLLERVSSVQKLFRIVGLLYKVSALCRKLPKESVSNTSLGKQAEEFWIKLVQKETAGDLEASVDDGIQSSHRIQGRFKRLSPFRDSKGIWRVGSRLREFVPFTRDHVAPALLPSNSRLSLLLMTAAHQKKHSGISETVALFRLSGYWVPEAARLAKSIKSKCVICRYLDRPRMNQVMGGPPGELMLNPTAWAHIELDLFGPFNCKSDVNKRSTMKVWGAAIVDKNSGAVHCDVVLSYSALDVIKMLRRFGSLRGWPVSITSDPGSQLESSSGKLESWWQMLQEQLGNFAAEYKFEWSVSPGNSPWRQGRTEVRIKIIKRLLKIAVGPVKLSPTELQTALYEIADLCNNRPIGVNKTPRADGSFDVLTPNCLLLGRAINVVPDDSKLAKDLKHSERYQLILQVTNDFWKRWTSEVTPEAVIRQKWHENQRNLCPKDIVLVHDSSPLKGRYVLAVVDSVKEGKDGRVRSCVVKYRIPNSREAADQYTGGKLVKLSRSIQRLTLLLPVEEQSFDLRVENGMVRRDREEVTSA